MLAKNGLLHFVFLELCSLFFLFVVLCCFYLCCRVLLFLLMFVDWEGLGLPLFLQWIVYFVNPKGSGV